MFVILLLLFTIIPVAEIFVLIRVGQAIGTWDTIGLVLITGILGAYAVRTQGRALFNKVETQWQRGEFPTGTLVDGLLIFIGGILLITPGLITDTMGLGMVLPPTRFLFIKTLGRLFHLAIQLGAIRVKAHDPFSGQWKDVYQDASRQNRPLKEANVIDFDSFKSQHHNPSDSD